MPHVGEDRAKVAADLDAREQRLESLYADYWRTEYKICDGRTKSLIDGRFKNKFVPLSRMIIFFETSIARPFPTGC